MIIISGEGKAYNVEVTAMHGNKQELAELLVVMQKELERKITESACRKLMLEEQANLLESLNDHTHNEMDLLTAAYDLREAIDIY